MTIFLPVQRDINKSQERYEKSNLWKKVLKLKLKRWIRKPIFNKIFENNDYYKPKIDAIEHCKNASEKNNDLPERMVKGGCNDKHYLL